MTKTIQLTGDLGRDYYVLRQAMKDIEKQQFLNSMSDYSPYLGSLGIVRLDFNVGSEYDDGSSYYDVIESLTAYDAKGEMIDLYSHVMPGGTITGLDRDEELYDLLNEEFQNHIDYLKEVGAESFNFLTMEVA